MGLRPAGSSLAVHGASVSIGVDAAWLARLEEGDRLDLCDARGAERTLVVVNRGQGNVLAECEQTTYLSDGDVAQAPQQGRRATQQQPVRPAAS